MEGFEGLTEEQLQQLIELGVIPDEQGYLAEQMQQANAVRNMAGPEMRGNGRVQVAANPLEFLGQGIQKYQAGNDLKEIGQKRRTLLDKQVAGRKALLDAIRGKQMGFQGSMINDPGIDPSGYA